MTPLNWRARGSKGERVLGIAVVLAICILVLILRIGRLYDVVRRVVLALTAHLGWRRAATEPVGKDHENEAR